MKKIDCKENAEDSNKAISVTVHLLTYMEAGEVESGISPKLNELNNEIEMYDIVDRILVEDQNLGPNMFPLTRGYAMKLSDLIVAVNMKKSIDEIQRELRPALSVKLSIQRSINVEGSEQDQNVYLYKK